MGGAIAALIALRKLLLPLSESAGSFGPFGGPTDANDTARSFLGALAFAIPGALVLAWHLREARRREGGRASRASWGGVLYFHLVALISLAIALGGVVAALNGLRDAVVPFCYESPSFSEGPLAADPTFDVVSPIPPIELPADFDPELLRSEECYPSTSEALRSIGRRDRRLGRRRRLGVAPSSRTSGLRRASRRRLTPHPAPIMGAW